MKTWSLRSYMLRAQLVVILLMGFLIMVLGFNVIKKHIVARAQQQVVTDLRAAHKVLYTQLETMRIGFSLLPAQVSEQDLERFRKEMKLDYLVLLTAQDRSSVSSELARRAFGGDVQQGVRIMGREELTEMGEDVARRCRIPVVSTPKVRPSESRESVDAMVLECAQPLTGFAGGVERVVYGGRILNRNFALIDMMHSFVFEDRLYQAKPVGTVTIFQNDVRIATNVLDQEGKRAVGTRVSQIVYERVIGQGRNWLDRAFVVTDWYLTGYEPIRDVDGNVIGILYVGVLEKQFHDLMTRIFLLFLGIVAGAVMLAVVLSVGLSAAIVQPVTKIVEATHKISDGDLDHTVDEDFSISELNHLAVSFNNMAAELRASYHDLTVSNEKLSGLNKNYLDLISFVSHELKAILASATMNAYAVRDGFLGMVNFKQQKALDSICRNLDYLASTVRNFLSLSRIEKGEMQLTKTDFSLRSEVIDGAIDSFGKQISSKHLQIVNAIEPAVRVHADLDLIRVVVNNLLSNAIKYGSEEGTVRFTATDTGHGTVQVMVYNDGPVIAAEDATRLFRRFSRLDMAQTRHVRGTGLGLFITRQIIEKHGRTIAVYPQERGNAFVFELEKGA